MAEQKQYLIEIPGMEGSDVWDAARWERNRDKLLADHPDTNVFELDAYNPDDENENDQYVISLPDTEGADVWDAARWGRNKEAFMTDHPEASVQRVRYVDYWGERATENRARREELTQPDADREARLASIGYFDDMSGDKKTFGLGGPMGLKPLSSAVQQNSVTGEVSYLDPKVEEFYANDTAYTERMAEIARLDAEYESNPSVVAEREWLAQVEKERAEYVSKMREETQASMEENVDKSAWALGYSKKHNPGVATSFATSGNIGKQTLKGMQENEKAENYQTAMAYWDKADRVRAEHSTFAQGAKNVAMNWWEEFQSQDDLETFTEVASILKRLEKEHGNLNEISDEAIENSLTDDEKYLIRSFLEYNTAMAEAGADMTKWYKGGQIAAEAVPFMLEILMTGGLYKAAGEAATKGVRKGLAKWIMKSAKGSAARATKAKVAKGLTGKAGAGIISALAGTAARTAVAPGTYTRMAEATTQIDEEGHLNVAKNMGVAAIDAYIENLSEESGIIFKKAFGLAGKGVKELGKAIGGNTFAKIGQTLGKNATMQALVKGYQSFMPKLEALGFHGLPEEIGEEILGNALREATFVQPGALKEMFVDGNFGTMLIGFAPMTLFGAAGSAANIAYINKEAARLGDMLRQTLSSHYRNDQIDVFMSGILSAENADQVQEVINPIIEAIERKKDAGQISVGQALAEVEMLYTYGMFAAKNKAMLFAQNEQNRELADAKRAELTDKYGKFWKEDENGRQSVQEAVLNDGRTVFVLSEPAENGEITIIDKKDGKKGFANAADIARKQVEGKQEMQEDSTTRSMDRYLEGIIANETQSAQTVRMRNDRNAQIDALRAKITEGTKINLGTEGSPVMVVARGTTKEGVHVVDSTGSEFLLGWDQAADALGSPIKVKTDKQIADEEIAAIARRNEERRKRSKVSSKPATTASEQVAAEAEKTVQEDNRHIPMNEDGTVNESAFWEQSPEDYAEWNDEQNQDGGADTLEQVAIAKNELAGLITQAQQAVLTSNPATRKAAKREVQRLQERYARIEALEEKYLAKAAAPYKERAQMWMDRTGAQVHLVESMDELANISTNAAMQSVRGGRVRGLAKDGKAYIYLPGITSEAEVDAVFMHEAVAHIGLQGLLGQQKYDELCAQVWQMMSPEARRYFLNYAGGQKGPLAAADEYIAHIAERIGAGVAEEVELSVWEKIVELVRNILRELGFNITMTEEELSGLLAEAYANLAKNMQSAQQTEAQKKEEKAKEAKEARSKTEMRYAELSETLTPEEITAVAYNDYNAAVKAYEDHRKNSPRVHEGESSKDYLERKKAYMEELERLGKNLSEEQKFLELVSKVNMENIEDEVMGAAEPGSLMDIANNDSGKLSIVTEDYLEEQIRAYAASEEGQKAGWDEEKISAIVAETQDLINAIHNSSTGNEFYDEFASKQPTIRLDWRDGAEKPIVTWTRANIEYKYDMSADLLCINNEGLEAVLSSDKMVALMEMFIPERKPKKGEPAIKFTADDYLELYNTLKDLGFVVPCKGCFDAAGRFKMLPSVAQKFAAEVNAVIAERNKDPKKFDDQLRAKAGEVKTVEGLPTASATKSAAIAVGVAGDNLTEPIKWTQLMSADGQTKMLSDWGGIFRAWQRTGAGRPKDKLLPEPYYGDIVSQHTTIIGKFGEKTPSFRDILVNTGTGLRRNSHSEFRPVLAVDEIQFMRDAFIKGLTVFKYMKELDDVRLFGKMGVKYNMSFFPEFVPGTKAAGLDIDGNYIASEESVGSREFAYYDENGVKHYDGMKGFEEARKHVNKDVSLSSVILSIPHLIKALTDVPTPSNKEGIWGSLIPFHSSGATSASLAAQGLGAARANGQRHGFEEAMYDYDKGVTNFEAVQNDRFGKGWIVVSGKKAGTAVEEGHKLEFVNGTHYYNKDFGVHLFATGYILDSQLPEGALKEDGSINLGADEMKSLMVAMEIDYNNKVREIGTPYAYKEAADYYLAELPKIGLIPRFDFTVDEATFLQMCADANVDPMHPKLGWKGEGNGWSPIDSEAYYSLFCDFGMTNPETGELSPHNPVGVENENGEREFRLPENAVEIVKEGLDRFSDVRRAENARIDEAITEFARRSVEKGRISQENVDKVLNADMNEDVRLSVRTDEEREQLFNTAKEKYGVTNNFNAAGYMLPDGSLLDFSEANDGGDPNQRSLDHRDIEGIIMDEGREYDSRWKYIADFMNEGAIRLLPESAGINMIQAPTEEQRKKIFDFVYKYNGEVILEIADERLNNIAYVEYNRRTSPSRIFRDIDGYFNEGIVPQQDIRFSVRGENESAEDFYKRAIEDYKAKYTSLADMVVYPINQETAEKFGRTQEELAQTGAEYVMEDGEFAIFVHEDVEDGMVVENTIFHEDIHFIADAYPHMYNLGNWLWDNADMVSRFKAWKEYIESEYDADQYADEMLAYCVSEAMSLGQVTALEGVVPAEYHSIIRQIENEIGYDRRSEESGREAERLLQQSGGSKDLGEQEGVQGEKGSAGKSGLTAEERRVINEFFPGAFRVTDSKGNTLTPEQEAFFANSKAVDKDGNLLVLYHGTPRAGFTEFKSGWFTTSKEDAISYSGDRKGRLFDPNEQYVPEVLEAGDFRLGYMTFDSEADRDAFLAEHPAAAEAMSEREFDQMTLEADEEYDDLIARKPELQKIWDAYREYERERFVDTTIKEMLDSPDAYTEDDFRRALQSYDSNAIVDEIDEIDNAADRKDDLVSVLNYAVEDTKENGEDLLDMKVTTRVPRNGSGMKHNDLGNRTYEVYANIENPYEIDAKGKGSEFVSGDIYKAVRDALADEQYDGVIIRNWRVGRYQQLGDVVVPKNGSQIKLTSNQAPTENEDIRFSVTAKEARNILDNYESGSDESLMDEVENALDILESSRLGELVSEYRKERVAGEERGERWVDVEDIVSEVLSILDTLAGGAIPVSYPASVNKLSQRVNELKNEYNDKYGDIDLDEWEPADKERYLSAIREYLDALRTPRFRVTGTPTEQIVAEGVSLSPAEMATLAGNIFAALPEDSRKKITDSLGGNILNLQDAVMQIPVDLAVKEEWDDEDMAVARIVANEMTKMVGREMTRPFYPNEALWMLYDSTHRTDGTDIISEATKALVRRNLGFSPRMQQLMKEIDEHIRYRSGISANNSDAIDFYNSEVNQISSRLAEVWLDMNESVIKMQDALAKATGMPIESWENVVLALNQLSSINLADKKKYMRDFLEPLWSIIDEIIRTTGLSREQVERYMMLKHGLERNEVFAKRDAKAYYREIYDDILDKVRNMTQEQKRQNRDNARKRYEDAVAERDRLRAIDSSALTDDQKDDLRKERAKATREADAAEKEYHKAEKIYSLTEAGVEHELSQIYDDINAGVNEKYLEFRKEDYGGLTSMFSDYRWWEIKPRSAYASEEEYQRAVLAARTPRYDDLEEMEAEAATEINDYEKKLGSKKDILWNRVNAATKETLRHQYDSNMLTKEQFDAVSSMFKFYVPLRGFADNTAQDMYDYYTSNPGNGFSAPIIAAKGRKSKAESPLGWIGSMAESAIQADNKNEVKLRLYYLATRRPNNGLLTVSETWYEYKGEKDDKGRKIFVPAYPPEIKRQMTAEELAAHMQTWEDEMRKKQANGDAYTSSQKLDLHGSVVFQDSGQEKEHTIRVKVGGKDYTMMVNGNPRAAQAINGLLNPDLPSDNAAVNKYKKWLRGLSALMTSWSPLFWVTNFQRDMLSSIQRTQLRHGAAYAAKYAMNRPRAWKVIKYIGKYQNAPLGDSYYEKLYTEFAENGGITGYTVLANNKEQEQMFEKYLKDQNTAAVAKWFKNAFGKVMDLGEAIEQVSRFAAYITARENGMEIEEAINEAKEVSVNFNRKGSMKAISKEEIKKLRFANGQTIEERYGKMAPAIEAAIMLASSAPGLFKNLYYFFNASVQAITGIAKLAAKKKGSAAAWAGLYFGTSLGLAIMYSLIGGDDDEKLYEDLPEYERRNNLLFKITDDLYFKWSIPQEMRPFFAWANIIVDHAKGRSPHKNIAGELASATAEWLPVNPFGSGDPIIGLMPDPAAPLLENHFNISNWGGTLYNEMPWVSKEVQDDIPAYLRAPAKSSKTIVDIAEFLNDLTNGQHDADVQAGWLNINPAKVEHLLEGYGGGAYTFANLAGKTLATIFGDDEFTLKNTPFLNKLFLSMDETNLYANTNEMFYHYKGIADNAERVVKEYEKKGDREKADAFRQTEDWQMHLIFNKYEEDLKDYSDRLKVTPIGEEADALKQGQNAIREMLLKDIANLEEGTFELDEVTQLRNGVEDIDRQARAARKQMNTLKKDKKAAVEREDYEAAKQIDKKINELNADPQYQKTIAAGEIIRDIKKQMKEIDKMPEGEEKRKRLEYVNRLYDQAKERMN